MSKVKEYYDGLSRYLCYLLRHEPEGLHMDQYGYVLAKDLIDHVKQMIKDGYKFGVTENGVWCIVGGPRYEIPTYYIKRIERRERSSISKIEIKPRYDDIGLDFQYTLGATIKDMISFFDNRYYLTLDIKKDIAKQIKNAYEKWEKEHE